MELKVWVDGIQRIVCGVTDNTTCQDVVYALAHATGKTGRFTLSERWRSNERLLSPQDHPLKVLLKWGEYSNDVQFILQRSVLDENKPSPSTSLSKQGENSLTLSGMPSGSPRSPDRLKDVRKSSTFTGSTQQSPESYPVQRIGIVRGIPKRLDNLDMPESKHLKYDIATSKPETSPSKREAPPYREPPGPPSGTSSPHQRALPPYRNPPPPTSSPVRSSTSGAISPTSCSSPNLQPSSKVLKPKKLVSNEINSFVSPSALNSENGFQEAVLCNSQYRELVRLVNFQREKLSAQQSDLTKFDAEIMYWENKAKEQHHQLEFLCQEKLKMEAACRQNEDHLRTLSHAEEEFELVRQQEKTLKSEISLLRSKLANCETELLQCKNKIRLLMEELHVEKMAALRDSDERQHLERALISEVDRLQHEIEQARQSAEMSAQCGENLQREVSMLESAIADRKRQLEQLLTEMKEANLQSLVIAPPEELKHLIEGPYKPGITRKMVGSPRQLENAVPTSKNPHGVWV